jgi:hypothetical protein
MPEGCLEVGARAADRCRTITLRKMVVEKLLDPILIEILRGQLTALHPVPNMGEAPEIGL